MNAKTTYTEINALLVQEDIEGYINFGAPDDEYSSEAQEITTAIAALSHEELTKENVTAIVAAIWAQNFNLAGGELELRMPNIRKLIDRIFS
ncbi:MAG: hypothetical protein EBQ96_08560 [Proteobacteria bacterium]|nr:hypothetical protein [Pseudomonadota bacterium]